MGGFFGVASKTDCVFDLFFGTDYHSHLGTKRGGMAVCGEDGFHLAYRVPGMIRVLQSAGRVIRTSQDRGAVLLIDERFFTQEYVDLMPAHFAHIADCYAVEDVETAVRRFYGAQDALPR